MIVIYRCHAATGLWKIYFQHSDEYDEFVLFRGLSIHLWRVACYRRMIQRNSGQAVSICIANLYDHVITGIYRSHAIGVDSLGYWSVWYYYSRVTVVPSYELSVQSSAALWNDRIIKLSKRWWEDTRESCGLTPSISTSWWLPICCLFNASDCIFQHSISLCRRSFFTAGRTSSW